MSVKVGTSRRELYLILLCFAVYACSYIGKLGYNANIKQIEQTFSVSHAESGAVGTFFFFAYGAGQIINGILCGRYNARIAVALALAASAGCNLFVGLSGSFAPIRFVWLINGAALSVLWPTLIKLLSECICKKNIANAVIVMGTTVATGTLAVYGLSALFVHLSIYRAVFFVAAGLLPAIAIVWIVAFPKVAKPAVEVAEDGTETVGFTKKKFTADIFVLLAVSAFYAVLINIIKDGLVTWIPNILIDKYSLPESLSLILTMSLPALSVFGTFVAAKMHSKIHDFVLLTMSFFILSAGLIGVILGFWRTDRYVVTIICVALVSCFMTGANNTVTSMMPMFMKTKVDSGLVAGVLDGFCYLGSMISAYGLGAIADSYGWNTVFVFMLAICGIVAAVGLIYYPYKRKVDAKKRSAQNIEEE